MLFRTWAILVALTVAAMLIGAGGAAGGNLLARGALLGITVLKASAVLRNFLELQEAPRGWQAFFYLYLALLGGLIFSALAVSGWHE